MKMRIFWFNKCSKMQIVTVETGSLDQDFLIRRRKEKENGGQK